MVKSLFQTLFFVLCAVMVSLIACSRTDTDTAASGASARSAYGWSRHNDPAGFSVDTPASWKVATDEQSGRITFSGERGERFTVWPGFIQGQQLDRNGAGTLVRQVARGINAQLSWHKPEYAGNMVRVVARSAQQNSVTILSWNPMPEGTSLLAFAIEAPPAVYRASVETFTGILSTFRVRQQTAGEGKAPQSYSPDRLSFVSWTDPRENALTISVPKGWETTGGLQRMSVNDVRSSVQIVSPDRQIWILVGDPNIGPFTQPTQLLARGGFREGSFQPLTDGTKLLIKRFRSGQQFAREYAEGVIGQQCGDLRVTASSDSPDLASACQAEVRAEASEYGINVQMTAGDVAFTCTLQRSGSSATPMVGHVTAVTGLASPSPLWHLYKLYGYLAPAGRQAEADSVCRNAAASLKLDPQWQMKQKQASALSVEQGKRESEATLQRWRMAYDAQRKSHEIVMDVIRHRNAVQDKIAHDWSNVNRGTIDVRDESTGKTYNVWNTPGRRWIDGMGNIVASPSQPSPYFRQMTDLP